MCAGLHQKERERLKIKAFYIRTSVSNTHKRPIPDSLTLHYLPRTNGAPPGVQGSSIRPDSPAFVTLHRVVSASTPDKPVFGSREQVRASEGVRFDVYFGEEKLLRGVFRRRDHEGEKEWKMGIGSLPTYNCVGRDAVPPYTVVGRREAQHRWEMECKCVLEGEAVGVVEVKAAEVWVEAEGMAAMSEKVVVVRRRRKRRGRRGDGGWFPGLEEIPEEEREAEEDEVEGCGCGGEERERGSDGGDCGGGGGERDGKMEAAVEVEITEGVRLAVDVGIWVVCLGVGCLVSSLSRINKMRPLL